MKPARLPVRVVDTDANRMSEIRDAEGRLICVLPMREADVAVDRLNGVEPTEPDFPMQSS